jgi:adenine-specific DNA-methyltransferase
MTCQFDRLPDILGNPFYQSEDVQVYCADSLTSLDKCPENLLSLTVTSPPYNIGKEYEEVIEQEKYLHWCEEWINKVYRWTSRNGAFWLNLGYFARVGRAKAIPIA